MALRVLLVDDNADFLESARRFLAAQPGLEVVGCARSGEEAVGQAASLRPDLVLMDLAMPGMNGLETTRRIKAEGTSPLVIIVTLYEIGEYVATARAPGADGFVAKSGFATQLLSLLTALRPDWGEIRRAPAEGGQCAS